MTMDRPPGNTIDAIMRHPVFGTSPSGETREMEVDTRGQTYTTAKIYTVKTTIPGIGTAAAYASGDAFGGKFFVPTPREGTIAKVVFYDLDDEGLSKDLVLFDTQFTATADNGEFDVSDADLLNCVGVIGIDTFYNFKSNQLGVVSPAYEFYAPNGGLWCQLVTRGADNIAANNLPSIMVVIV